MKKPLRIAGISVLIILLILILLPFAFKGKIERLVKSEINKNLNARVDFSNADVSLIRHFPDVSLRLEDLKVIGTDQFEKDTLLAVKSLGLSLNLMSVISGETLRINAVDLEQPRIFALVNKNGIANWDIVKADTSKVDTATESKPLSVQLKKYSISKGYIVYRDEQSNMSAKIVNLDHEGKGDFTANRFTLETHTTAEAVNVSYGGIAWLNKIRTNIDADIDIDNTTSTYRFNTEKIELNDLRLSSGGFFRIASADQYDMDINFKSLSTSFKNILSFVPAIYQKDFASIKTSGSLAFNGQVKGRYTPSSLPAYSLNLDIKNGSFQYPDLPKAVRNINLKASISNPDGITDHTVVNIPNGHIEMDGSPFDFRVNLQRPVSALLIDAAAKGRLNLSTINSLVKLEKGTAISGLLDADVAVKGSAAAAQKQQYDQFFARGTIGLKNFLYRSGDYPEGVKISSLLMSFNPRNVTLSQMAGAFMNTNFTASGTLNNLLAYAIKNQPLDGTINVTADKVDLNKWMGTTSSAPEGTAASAPFAVPANLNLRLNAKAGSVHYDKLDIHNLSGSLSVKDETVRLENVQGSALDGTMGISGSYSTRTDRKKPDIGLTYDVKDVDIQKTFYAFNTVQKLMPLGRFLAGKLSSSMSMNGKLGENMMPDLSSLAGNGNVLLLQGVLQKFKPVEKMATALNISSLQEISMKDVKSYFEFAGGKVLVKPFNLKVRDIDMEIGGLHGIDQSLNYTLNMKVPRALMGERGNALVNGLVSKANSKGVPVSVAEKVNLLLKIEGSIARPVVKTSLKESTASLAQSMKEQSVQFVKTKVESAKQAAVSAAKDSLASAKRQIAEKAAAELTKRLSGHSDTAGNKGSARKDLEETGKGLIKNLNPFKTKPKTTESEQ